MTAVEEKGAPAAALPAGLLNNPSLSSWVRVHADGRITLSTGKVELGQGIVTALAQLAAEELDVPMHSVAVRATLTGSSPDEGVTAGSMSVSEAGAAVRMACAGVRRRFVEHAAKTWGLDPDEVTVADGVISARNATVASTYGDLAEVVSLDVGVSADVKLKTPQESILVGTSAPRVDLPDKIAGRPSFVSDLRLPGQLFGRVVRPPSPGARLVALEEPVTGDADLTVVRDGSFLGVVGTAELAVNRAAETLCKAAVWSQRETLPDENDLVGYLKRGPHTDIPVLGETPTEPGDRTLVAEYSRPFLAHGSIAPSCGIASWEADGTLHVWSHSQGVYRLRDAIAQALGLLPKAVRVQHVENAGCYGHNAADDAAFDAVLLARAVPGRPVRVLWSRRDELSWSPFGSAMTSRVEASLDAAGSIRSWSYDVWSQGHTSRPGYAGVPGLLAAAHLETPLTPPPADDPPVRTGGGTTRNAVPLYDVGFRRVVGHRLLQAPLRSSALRALGAYLNVFSIESFMDELAASVDEDPVAYRLRHLSDERARAVLQTATSAAGWERPVEDGIGRGVGLARYKDRGAYCAVVAEVAAEHDVSVRKLTIAVDVGRVVNPDGVLNQIEGGATQATSWTLKERVRFDRTRVTSDDWESYPILRFSEVPEIDVHLLDRPHLPSVGAGEAAQGPTAGAIGNAVAAALDVRVRDLPLTYDAVVAAIEADEH